MNILVLGGGYLVAASRGLGHRVFHVNHGAEADWQLTHPVFWHDVYSRLKTACFQPDAVFYLDNGNMPMLIDPESIECPSIFYSIDTYCNPWHVGYGHGFDLTLVAQKDFLPLFLKEDQDARWFPLFCQAEKSICSGAERDIPVSFVGTLGHKNNPRREPFLRRFRKFQPLAMLSGDFRPIFMRSKIVLNQTAFGEINFRCFEAMALGAALLMEKCDNGFEDLFSPGENILEPYTRDDAREAARIAASYLDRPDMLAAIARSGMELVLKRHSDAARAAEIIACVAELAQAGAVARRKAEIGRRKALVRASFGILASELVDSRWSAHQQFFLELARE